MRQRFAEHGTKPLFDDIRGAALLERRPDLWTDTLGEVYRGDLCLVFDCESALSAMRRSPSATICHRARASLAATPAPSTHPDQFPES